MKPSLYHGSWRPIAQRFSTSYIVNDDGCWHWIRRISQSGYGVFELRRKQLKRSIVAHRIAWMVHRGRIPAGMVICHKCDVRYCVNPEHLFLGTQRDNMQDMIAKGRACNWRGGRPFSLDIAARVAAATSNESAANEARRLGLHRSTVHRWRKQETLD